MAAGQWQPPTTGRKQPGAFAGMEEPELLSRGRRTRSTLSVKQCVEPAAGDQIADFCPGRALG